MPNPTDLYLVIRSFLDKNGNSFQAREIPYQYGELPTNQRDNIDFCVPFNKTEIKTEVLTKETKEYIGKPNDATKPIEVKLKQVETKVTIKEEEPVVETKIEEVKSKKNLVKTEEIKKQ